MSLANRIALRAVRPSVQLGLRATPHYSTPTEPKEKATSIINSLPGSNILTKTGILATSAAAGIYAVANHLYVVNDETILLVSFSLFTGLCAKFVAPLYKDWADGQLKHISDLLNQSRTRHVEAVKERIESVAELKDVVATTQQLFAVSKETVQLEAKSFELKQKIDLIHEAKASLDSWVRYEQQQRQLEQEQLAKSVIEKVQKELANPKTQEKILQESVAEIEKLFAAAK